MARTARASVGGMIYHALNRGNRRESVFHTPADYDAFVGAMADARRRLPVDLFGYCLMPNHFHLVLRPQADGDLGRWMQWLLTTHARRYHRHYRTSGHVWQGRFKAFPIQDNEHLVTVLRDVERNPLRAELVARAEDWRWSSLPGWLEGDPLLWRGDPPPRDEAWLTCVNEPLSAGDLQRLRHSVERGRPFGDEAWTRATAARLGLGPVFAPAADLGNSPDGAPSAFPRPPHVFPRRRRSSRALPPQVIGPAQHPRPLDRPRNAPLLHGPSA